jgi:diguanylate cyclase (GGDEF)-like protein
MNVNTFEELRLSGNLPTPAGIGMRILQLTRTEDYSADEMGQAIMSDSSLTGRILKLANSAARGGREPATTVSEAIMRLGSRSVRDLALAFSLVSERSAGTCKAFDYELYWSRSLARAVAAQTLSRVMGYGKPEEAYICGLLGEIGMLALASVYAEKYAELLVDNRGKRPEELLEPEDEAFNINHSQVGLCMLEDWGLPEAFREAVAGFTSKRQVEAGGRGITDPADLLRLANAIAEAMVGDDTTRDVEWQYSGAALECVRATLGMDESGFQRFFDTCCSEWVAWGESLEVNTTGTRYALVQSSVEEALRRLENGEPDPNALEPDVARAGGRGNVPVDAPTRDPLAVEISDRYKVLAVDDDPVSLKVLSRHLQNAGYEVITARGGKEALKTAFRSTPEIVIADWEMPDLDGLELCRSLRRTDMGANMYFLLLTGKEDGDLLVDAFDAGVDDFVTKPFNPRVLSARIKGGIRLAKQQRRIEADKQTMMRQVAELGVLTRKLRATSLTDALTELPNRRYAMKRMGSEWASTKRTGRPLSVVMLDIDHFKAVNDTYGHDVGDAVLRDTAQTIRAATRATDEVCRIGGEEFLIICKHTTESDCSVAVERIRSAVESHIVEEPSFMTNVTVSMGYAAFTDGMTSFNDLLKAADEAVYVAKANGRNRAVSYTELQDLRHSA